MTTIKKFVFNPFQENTFLLYDDSGECIIIDPGCYEPHEKEEMTKFMETHELKPVRLIYTHCHVDHILGNNFIVDTFGLNPELHKAGLPFLQQGHRQGEI